MKFSSFINQAESELKAKQEQLSKKFRLLGQVDYQYNQDEGWVKWIDPDSGREVLKYKAVSVGSFNTDLCTWQWAWARFDLGDSEEVLLSLIRQISILAETFPEKKDLQNPMPFAVDEFYGQEISAALVKLLNGDGIYQVSHNDGEYNYQIYFSLIEPIM